MLGENDTLAGSKHKTLHDRQRTAQGQQANVQSSKLLLMQKNTLLTHPLDKMPSSLVLFPCNIPPSKGSYRQQHGYAALPPRPNSSSPQFNRVDHKRHTEP